MSEACRRGPRRSFLRPAEVKEARAAFREGRLPLEELRILRIAPSWLL